MTSEKESIKTRNETKKNMNKLINNIGNDGDVKESERYEKRKREKKKK